MKSSFVHFAAVDDPHVDTRDACGRVTGLPPSGTGVALEVDGRVGNYFTYVLTPAGEKVAQDFIARVAPEGATQR